MYPRIVVDTKKLKHNMDALIAMGHEQGISIGLVSKCVCAHAPIIELMNQTEADFIADSRLLNLKNIKTKKAEVSSAHCAGVRGRGRCCIQRHKPAE